jgi:hypothetical protein
MARSRSKKLMEIRARPGLPDRRASILGRGGLREARTQSGRGSIIVRSRYDHRGQRK